MEVVFLVSLIGGWRAILGGGQLPCCPLVPASIKSCMVVVVRSLQHGSVGLVVAAAVELVVAIVRGSGGDGVIHYGVSVAVVGGHDAVADDTDGGVYSDGDVDDDDRGGRCMAMHHAPCTMHHAPCTMHHAPCTMHHIPPRIQADSPNCPKSKQNLSITCAGPI